MLVFAQKTGGGRRKAQHTHILENLRLAPARRNAEAKTALHKGRLAPQPVAVAQACKINVEAAAGDRLWHRGVGSTLGSHQKREVSLSSASVGRRESGAGPPSGLSACLLHVPYLAAHVLQVHLIAVQHVCQPGQVLAGARGASGVCGEAAAPSPV